MLRGWRAYVEQAPDEVTSVIVTITFPADPDMPEAVHDRAVAIVGGVYAGDVEEGIEEMQPLRELGTVLFDMSGPTPFVGVQSGFDPLFPRNQLQAYWKSQYLDELPDDAIDTIAAKAQRPAGAADAREHLPHGRSDRRRRARGRPRSTSARRRTWSRSTGCGRTPATTRPTSAGCARPGRT